VTSGIIIDRFTQLTLGLILLLSTAGLAFILVFILREAYPAMSGENSVLDYLFRTAWTPLARPPEFGIVHSWLSTLMLVAICIAMAAPVGFGIGLFISDIAPVIVRLVLQPCLDVLAGIPSVVYGFFGYVTLVPWFEVRYEMATGECILVAALILAVMVLPFVASVSAGAFQSVSANLREAALAQGVTRWYMIRRVVIPKAAPGMFAAVTLALTRAIGETMAVLMLTGNSVALPVSPLDRGQPLTALIATEFGEAGVGSEKYYALFASASVLVALVFAFNVLTWTLKRKLISNEH